MNWIFIKRIFETDRIGRYRQWERKILSLFFFYSKIFHSVTSRTHRRLWCLKMMECIKFIKLNVQRILWINRNEYSSYPYTATTVQCTLTKIFVNYMKLTMCLDMSWRSESLSQNKNNSRKWIQIGTTTGKVTTSRIYCNLKPFINIYIRHSYDWNGNTFLIHLWYVNNT